MQPCRRHSPFNSGRGSLGGRAESHELALPQSSANWGRYGAAAGSPRPPTARFHRRRAARPAGASRAPFPHRSMLHTYARSSSSVARQALDDTTSKGAGSRWGSKKWWGCSVSVGSPAALEGLFFRVWGGWYVLGGQSVSIIMHRCTRTLPARASGLPDGTHIFQCMEALL